jgi:glycine hydroxymethyltransferase
VKFGAASCVDPYPRGVVLAISSAASPLAEHATGFFSDGLAAADPEVTAAIDGEREREQSQIELIASENIVSQAVLDAQGSLLTNKYAEGYPGRRYYGGCEFVDVAERLAIERAKRLFGCGFANVQPHAGAQANQAVFLALLKPGETILGMSLAAGGHLTHGAAPNLSGKWFHAVTYGVRADDARIDFDEVERQAEQHRPRLIIAGGSAYPRVIDFARFRAIADRAGAYLMVDMAHFAGLVAGRAHPNPIPHAHVVTTTTHKTLRGPRGGMILSDDPEIARRIDSAVFPGLQGGPLMHVIAAKAVALKLAATDDFRRDMRNTVENAQVLAGALASAGARVVSGGTDNHLMLVDVTPLGVTGKEAEAILDEIGITVNKNAIPFDQNPPNIASGIRVGTPATTTRGFGPPEMRELGRIIIAAIGSRDDPAEQGRLAAQVRDIAGRFPVPGLADA